MEQKLNYQNEVTEKNTYPEWAEELEVFESIREPLCMLGCVLLYMVLCIIIRHKFAIKINHLYAVIFCFLLAIIFPNFARIFINSFFVSSYLVLLDCTRAVEQVMDAMLKPFEEIYRFIMNR